MRSVESSAVAPDERRVGLERRREREPSTRFVVGRGVELVVASRWSTRLCEVGDPQLVDLLCTGQARKREAAEVVQVTRRRELVGDQLGRGLRQYTWPPCASPRIRAARLTAAPK